MENHPETLTAPVIVSGLAGACVRLRLWGYPSTESVANDSFRIWQIPDDGCCGMVACKGEKRSNAATHRSTT